MNDLEIFKNKYGNAVLDNLVDICFSCPIDQCYTSDYTNNNTFEVTISSDYVGGLEGNYSNTITGSVEVSDGTLWYITVVDIFCSDTEIDIEWDRDYTNTLTTKEGDLHMATVTARSPKTIHIIDNNKFVDDDQSIIFTTEGVFSGSDQQILLQIMAENDIQTILNQYNETRVKVVDQEKELQSGLKGYTLPPLKIRDLTSSSEVSILIK